MTTSQTRTRQTRRTADDDHTDAHTLSTDFAVMSA